MTSFISFARRKNEDSTIDTICMRCYQTVASAANETTLENAEQIHICDPNGEFSFPHTGTNLGAH